MHQASQSSPNFMRGKEDEEKPIHSAVNHWELTQPPGSPRHSGRHSWETKQEPPPALGHSRQLGTELTGKPSRANCGSGFRQRRAQEDGKEDTHRAATREAAAGPSILLGAPGRDGDRPGWNPAHIPGSYWRAGLSSLFFFFLMVTRPIP